MSDLTCDEAFHMGEVLAGLSKRFDKDKKDTYSSIYIKLYTTLIILSGVVFLQTLKLDL